MWSRWSCENPCCLLEAVKPLHHVWRSSRVTVRSAAEPRGGPYISRRIAAAHALTLAAAPSGPGAYISSIVMLHLRSTGRLSSAGRNTRRFPSYTPAIHPRRATLRAAPFLRHLSRDHWAYSSCDSQSRLGAAGGIQGPAA